MTKKNSGCEIVLCNVLCVLRMFNFVMFYMVWKDVVVVLQTESN